MRTQTKVSLCAPSTVDLWKIPRQWRAKMPECTGMGGGRTHAGCMRQMRTSLPAFMLTDIKWYVF